MLIMQSSCISNPRISDDFFINPFAPIFLLSSACSKAVESMNTGISFVSGIFFSSAKHSMPFISGILKSRKIKSGSTSEYISLSSASFPLLAKPINVTFSNLQSASIKNSRSPVSSQLKINFS